MKFNRHALTFLSLSTAAAMLSAPAWAQATPDARSAKQAEPVRTDVFKAQGAAQNDSLKAGLARIPAAATSAPATTAAPAQSAASAPRTAASATPAKAAASATPAKAAASTARSPFMIGGSK